MRDVAVAIPVLSDGDKQKLVIIQSRRHPDRFVFPKGGVDDTDKSACAAAEREAYEEAGIIGSAHPIMKKFKSPSGKKAKYHLNVLKVDNLLESWQEQTERPTRLVLSIEEALERVSWREEIASNVDELRRILSQS